MELSDIAVINPDGTGLTKLTNTPMEELMGGWSSDGSKILFTRGDPATQVAQVWVMNADGTGQTQLTNGPGVPNRTMLLARRLQDRLHEVPRLLIDG
jgi:Tol biopolymer transport system component